ncbi:MAG: iron-sulfur cluster assembly accessory protein [Ferruginibacter sp.]|nr:iron-sulfur cluster assembly accessory protein [Cytophagales bacterium]
MISVTEKAKDRITELRSKEGYDNNYHIRVAVEGGGCSGLMYNLDFDSASRPNDQVFEDKGIKIMVDKKSLLYLIGTVLDFSDGLNGKGFQFVNPNATRTCGCGESFAV